MMNKLFINSNEQKHIDKLKGDRDMCCQWETDLIRGDKGELKERLWIVFIFRPLKFITKSGLPVEELQR